MAKTELYMPTGQGTSCKLLDSSNPIDLDVTSGPNHTPMSLLAPLTTGGSTVSVQCGSNETDAYAYQTHLVAIKLNSVSGS